MEDQERLRALVARVEESVTRNAQPGIAESDRKTLTKAWGDLAAYLDLQPPPEVRACPRCGHEIMRAATLCKFCWAKSPGSVDG